MWQEILFSRFRSISLVYPPPPHHHHQLYLINVEPIRFLPNRGVWCGMYNNFFSMVLRVEKRQMCYEQVDPLRPVQSIQCIQSRGNCALHVHKVDIYFWETTPKCNLTSSHINTSAWLKGSRLGYVTLPPGTTLLYTTMSAQDYINTIYSRMKSRPFHWTH